MAVSGGLAIGALGAGAGLYGMFSNKQQPTPQQQPVDISPYLANASGSIGNLGQYNIGAQFAPDVSGIAQGYMQNPYANQGQAGAGFFSIPYEIQCP